MEDDTKVRTVTQYVLRFVLFKGKVIETEPSPELCFMPEISAELLNNLRYSVLIQSIHNGFMWEEFVNNHFECMITSPFRFANYIIYVSFHVFGKSTNAYEFFFEILSFVTFITLHCWQRVGKLFINACVDLFCAIFEETIRTKFENQGGWKHFNKFFEKLDILQRNKPTINNNVCMFEHYEKLHNDARGGVKLITEINGVLIKDIRREEVETNKRALCLAKSVADKISELSEKEFKEILIAMTNRQVKAMYPRTVEKASGEMPKEEKFSSQHIIKEKLQNIPNISKHGREKQTVSASDNLENQNFFNHPKIVDALDKASHGSFNSTKLRILLGDIAKDMSKLTEIVESLFQQYDMQVPPKEGFD